MSTVSNNNQKCINVSYLEIELVTKKKKKV